MEALETRDFWKPQRRFVLFVFPNNVETWISRPHWISRDCAWVGIPAIFLTMSDRGSWTNNSRPCIVAPKRAPTFCLWTSTGASVSYFLIWQCHFDVLCDENEPSCAAFFLFFCFLSKDNTECNWLDSNQLTVVLTLANSCGQSRTPACKGFNIFGRFRRHDTRRLRSKRASQTPVLRFGYFFFGLLFGAILPRRLESSVHVGSR